MTFWFFAFLLVASGEGHGKAFDSLAACDTARMITIQMVQQRESAIQISPCIEVRLSTPE